MYFIDEKACHATAHTALTGFVMLSFAVLSDRMAMHGLQIEEAKARFDSILNDSSDHGRRYSDAAKAMKVDFVCTHDIGDKVWAAGPPYDCVSCMFALHYFFHSEDTARRAVEMAAKNLKHGGHFIGVLPNARHVMDTIGPEMKPLHMKAMKLAPKWAGQPQTFGSAYTCALTDTVTEVRSSAPLCLVAPAHGCLSGGHRPGGHRNSVHTGSEQVAVHQVHAVPNDASGEASVLEACATSSTCMACVLVEDCCRGGHDSVSVIAALGSRRVTPRLLARGRGHGPQPVWPPQTGCSRTRSSAGYVPAQDVPRVTATGCGGVRHGECSTEGVAAAT